MTESEVKDTKADMKSVFFEALARGHDAFFELRGTLQDGTKSYNDLTQLLVTFQNEVSDFCSARKAERAVVLSTEQRAFYLGRESMADRMFQYEVKIIFGKNLHKALPPNFTPPPNPKYQVRNLSDAVNISFPIPF